MQDQCQSQVQALNQGQISKVKIWSSERRDCQGQGPGKDQIKSQCQCQGQNHNKIHSVKIIADSDQGKRLD